MNQREYVESMRAYEHKKLRELKKKIPDLLGTDY